ncbi:MAG: alpha/beta fold hydrolase [Flavobacteriaceae bacterium]
MLHYTTFQAEHNPKEKPWITFIHGAGGSSSIWFKQIRYFSRDYNLLLIDLRGHGNSKSLIVNPFQAKYTFEIITNDIVEVLDHLQLKKSHFVGISLGTILIRQLAQQQPHRVQSMIMGGAIIQLNLRSRILMHLGNLTKSVLPYMWIYKLFAFIIMPKKNHRQSRLLFVREAQKLYQKEFLRWYKLTSEILPKLHLFRQKALNIPTLYIMGEQDYMFLASVREIVTKHQATSLLVVPQCGHVVNVEQPEAFNQGMYRFLKSLR